MGIFTNVLLISSMVLLAGAVLSAFIQLFGGWSRAKSATRISVAGLTFIPTGLMFLGYIVSFALWLGITA